MSATFVEARDDTFTLFKAAWDTFFGGANDSIDYPNVANKSLPPETDEPWARIALQHIPDGQRTLSGDTGKRRWGRLGLFTAQLFLPVGEGTTRAYNLSKAIKDAFEGAATSNGVWYRDVSAQEVGSDRNWFQINVLAFLTYDEVK